MATLNTTIGEDLPVEVEYELTGSYFAATDTDPEELAEYTIEAVLVNGHNIVMALSDEIFNELLKECDEAGENE